MSRANALRHQAPWHQCRNSRWQHSRRGCPSPRSARARCRWGPATRPRALPSLAWGPATRPRLKRTCPPKPMGGRRESGARPATLWTRWGNATGMYAPRPQYENTCDAFAWPCMKKSEAVVTSASSLLPVTLVTGSTLNQPTLPLLHYSWH